MNVHEHQHLNVHQSGLKPEPKFFTRIQAGDSLSAMRASGIKSGGIALVGVFFLSKR